MRLRTILRRHETSYDIAPTRDFVRYCVDTRLVTLIPRTVLRWYHALCGADTRLLAMIPRTVWRRHETSYDDTTHCVAKTQDFSRWYHALCGADTRLLTMMPRAVWRRHETSYDRCRHETSYDRRRHETSYDDTTYCVAQTRDLVRKIAPLMLFCLFLAQKPTVEQSLHIHEVSRSHNDAPQSVVLLWTSDQPLAKTYLTTYNTIDRHPCPRWDSNPQSQQASGRRPTP